ncbi:hypothetical protein [Rhodococcus koreensis]|uniref:hypothetical protein n=1 Tax=Rhodococcus koreensis TaxID=99653 RepID=UPI0036DA7021
MIAFSSTTVLLADNHLPAGAPDEGEFPLFVVLAILAVLAVMAVVAAHHRHHNPDEFSDIAGRYGSNRHESAAQPQPESFGHPLDRIDPR